MMSTKRITQLSIILVLIVISVGCTPPPPNPPKLGHYEMGLQTGWLSFDLTDKGIENFSPKGKGCSGTFPSSLKVEKQSDNSVTFSAVSTSGEKITGKVNGDGANGTYAFTNCTVGGDIQHGVIYLQPVTINENGDWEAVWINTEEIQRIITILEANYFHKLNAYNCVECEGVWEDSGSGIDVTINANSTDFQFQDPAPMGLFYNNPWIGDLEEVLGKIYGTGIKDWLQNNLAGVTLNPNEYLLTPYPITAKIDGYQVELDGYYIVTVYPIK